MSHLHDKSYKIEISSLYEVGVPSKHARNEDEKHLNSCNSTKRNINGQTRAICMQDSGHPGYNHKKKNGAFKEKQHNKMWN